MLRGMFAGGDGSSAVEIARQVRAGEVSARRSIELALERARAAQARTNAFITIAEEHALVAAERLDARLAAGEDVGPLAGVPLVVKDNLCTNGLRTTAGSQLLAGFVPPYDATVVARLAAAGAVVIGKANLDEFGMGSGNENSYFGAVRNPLDERRVAGGSSGGSAAAVAAGAAPLALGSDTGGSARLPASFCGIFGFKPSYGALSRYGLVAFASSLDQVGIMGRELADVELAFELTAGADPYDATSFDLVAADLSGVRVALVAEFMDGSFGAAGEATRRAAEQLAQLGAIVTEVSVPSARHATACYHVVAAAEASSNLARFDGTLYGTRASSEAGSTFAAGQSDAAGQEAAARATRSALLGPEVKRRILFGSLVLSAGERERFYGRALRVRRLIADELAAALSGADYLLLPTAAGVAFPLDGAEGFASRFSGEPLLTDMATSLANLAGLPALSVPFGAGEGGLPLGVQMMGRHGSDRALLTVAHGLVTG